MPFKVTNVRANNMERAMNLENLIRDMVAKGEMTHLTLSPFNGQWSASFCAASPLNGYMFTVDKDPVEALTRAMTEIKLRKPRGKAKTEGFMEQFTATVEPDGDDARG